MFDKVIGFNSLKEDLLKTIDVLNNKEKYKKYGITHPEFFCLIGDPGIGKTLISTEFMNCIKGYNKYIIRKNSYDGKFVDYINSVFEEAKHNQPAIILLDDMDKFANNDNYHTDAPEFVCIQTKIDEIKNCDVFVLGTVNNLEAMPNSLLRSGRLKPIYMEKLSPKDNALLIKYFLKEKKELDGLSIDELSKIMSDCTCAEIESILNQASIYAAYNNKNYIGKDDVIRAYFKAKNNSAIFDDYENESIKEKICIHEAGHAVVAEILEPGSIKLITIKESDDIGGCTYYYQDENYWCDIKYMKNRVISLMGGKAAIEILYNTPDVGCNSDMRRVFEITERLVDDYCCYGFDKFQRKTSSYELRRRKEDHVHKLLNDFYETAKKILFENKEFLISLKNELMNSSLISGSDVQKVKRECGII